MIPLIYGEYRNGSDVIMLNRPTIMLWSKLINLPNENYTYDKNTNIIKFGDGTEFTYRIIDIINNQTGRVFTYNPLGVLVYGIYGTGAYGTPQFVVSETSITVNGQGTSLDLGPYTYSNSTIRLNRVPPAPWTTYQTLTFVNDVSQDAYLRDSNGHAYLLTSASSIKKTPKLSRSSLRSSEVVTIKNPVINLVTDFVWSSSTPGIYDIGDPHLFFDGYTYYMTSSQSWSRELLDNSKQNIDITARTAAMPNNAKIVRKGNGTVAKYGVPLWKCNDAHNLNNWTFYGNIFEADVNGVFWAGDEFYYCIMWAPQLMQLNGDNGKFVLIVSTARYPDYSTAYNNVRNLKDIGVFYAITDSVENFAINKVEPPDYSTGRGFDSYNGQAPNGRRTILYPFIVSPNSGPSSLTGVSYSNFKCTPTPTTFIRGVGPHDYYSMCIDGDLMYDPELGVHYLCFVHDPNGNVSENIGIVQVEYDQGSEKFSVVNSACNVIYPFTSTTEFSSVYTTLNNYCTSSCQVTDTLCKAACNYQLGGSEYANTWGRGAGSFSIEAPSLLKRRSSTNQFFYYLFYSGGEYNGTQYSINYIAAPSVNELRSGSTTRWHGRFISQISGSVGASPTYSFGHGHHARPGPDGHMYYSYHMSDLTHTGIKPPRQVCISRLDFFQSKTDPTKGDAYIYPVQGNFMIGENKKVKGF